MFNWLANLFASFAATPETLAQRALQEARLELFRAEQKVLESQLLANFYRERVSFLEQVRGAGPEAVSDRRLNREGGTTLKLTPRGAAAN